MTNHWVDIKNADLVLIMGGNAAEAHPCGFKWVTEAKAHKGAKLIVVDPRFTRSAAVADLYAPLRPGSDIAFLGGVINYLITNNKIQHEYVRNYTDMTFVVRADFEFKDGLYSGYDAKARKYDRASWNYEIGPDGYVVTDPTLKHPRCVYNLLKKHYSRYTPEVVEDVCGTPKEAFLKVCEHIATTAVPNRTMTVMYALGWTQHTYGSQIIRTAAMVQLLLGNIGMPGGGVNALRGHANVQGITDIGQAAHLLPGYLSMPTEKEPTLEKYLATRKFKPLRPGQLSYWQNYPKFYVSLMKAWFGDAASKDNDWGYQLLPKNDKVHDVLQIFEDMHQGKLNGFVCQGFNPIAAAPCKVKVGNALGKLKYLVIIDPLVTETSTFWKNHGEFNNVDPTKIQTEVFRLPSSCFAEDEGSFTNSGRTLQWHWKGAEPPGEAKGDIEIVAGMFMKLRELYQKDGGAFPDPIVKLTWPHKIPYAPSPEELAREFSGKALADIVDPKTRQVVRKAGEQVDGFAQLKDDGTTACGCWIYSGTWTEKGNMMARRDNSDPSGLGNTLNWGFAWPANRRILYNRACCDPSGKPWDPKRRLLSWDAKAKKWAGVDIPDFKPDSAPEDKMGPFIMTPEGVARLFSRGLMAEGPFPEHYEPFESPLDVNPLHPKNPLARNNPAVRLFDGDRELLGTAKEFPYVATSYRLVEHFHFWTKQIALNAITQPEQFVEIGEELAREKGIASGDTVKVFSSRGYIKAVAVVTKRIRALTVSGKKVHTVGIPIHWGYESVARKGYLTNTLTPYVGDANVQTPEYKAFLVDIAKA
jgi:formate dehydrogenase major subunit